MNKELKTCGFGKCNKCNLVNFGKKQLFGSSYESFYKKGNFMTPGIKKCLNIIYGPKDASYSFGSTIDSDIRYLKNKVFKNK